MMTSVSPLITPTAYIIEITEKGLLGVLILLLWYSNPHVL